MKAELLLWERHQLRTDAFAELVIWNVPTSVRGSDHRLKYRLVFVVAGRSVGRFDNEAGKGDHKHVGHAEAAYAFSTTGALLRDFWNEVDQSLEP